MLPFFCSYVLCVRFLAYPPAADSVVRHHAMIVLLLAWILDDINSGARKNPQLPTVSLYQFQSGEV